MSDPGQISVPPRLTWEAPSGPPSPTPTANQPMTFGDLFDRAVSIYQHGFVPLLLVTAVIQLPIAIIDGLLARQVASSLGPLTDLFSPGSQPTNEQIRDALRDSLPAITSAGIGAGVVSFIGGLLLAPALIETVARVDRGQQVSVGDAYGTALRRFPAILGGSIAIAVAIFLILLAVIVVGIVLAVAVGGWAIALLSIVAVVAPIWVGIRVALWQQAVVLEDAGPFQGFRRSWDLVRGSMWRTLLLILLVFIASGIAGVIFGVMGGLFGEAAAPLVSGILGVLTGSWATIALTLLFFDLRGRYAGAAATMAAGMPMGAPPIEASWPTTPTTPRPEPATPSPEPATPTREPTAGTPADEGSGTIPSG